MSDLEKYIKAHREEFDLVEPQSGHAERFALQMEKQLHGDHKSRMLFWRIAASVIILVVLSLSIWLPKMDNPENVQYSSLSLSDISTEFAEVENYYKSRLEEESKKLEALSTNDPEVAAYQKEIENLGIIYSDLEKQLYQSGTHEQVIQAMIENLRLRLTLIENLEKKNSTESNND